MVRRVSSFIERSSRSISLAASTSMAETPNQSTGNCDTLLLPTGESGTVFTAGSVQTAWNGGKKSGYAATNQRILQNLRRKGLAKGDIEQNGIVKKKCVLVDDGDNGGKLGYIQTVELRAIISDKTGIVWVTAAEKPNQSGFSAASRFP